MGKKNSAAPTPPDPVAVSQAQSQSNIDTAREQQRLNQVGTSGPQGSVKWVADPSQPGGYSQVTSLAPDQQAILDAQNRTELGATNIAQDQLGRVQGALQTPLDTSGLPDLQGPVGVRQMQFAVAPSGQIQSDVDLQHGFNPGGALQYGFDPGQSVQGHVGPTDLQAANKQAQDAAYGMATSRLDPQFAKLDEQQRTQLANQGFSQNSQGYKDAMDQFARQRTDAYQQAQNAAVTQGNTAADQLFGQSLQQGQFANQAAGQQYAQNQGQAGFNNQTAGQDYSQNMGQAQFANQAALDEMNARNSAQQQLFGQNLAGMQAGNEANTQAFQVDSANAQLGNTARNQGLQERAYQQNMPINQLTGLLSLGQVSNPQGIQYTPSQVAPTDVVGAYGLQSAAQQAAYKSQLQNESSGLGGLFNLGVQGIKTFGPALLASDRRLKRDIRRIGRRPDGLPLYRFRYMWDHEMREGVMAQDVLRVKPEAVHVNACGYMAVDYGAL